MISNVEMLSILNKWIWTGIDLSINMHKVRFSPKGRKHRVPEDEKCLIRKVHKQSKIKEWPFRKEEAVGYQLYKKRKNTSCRNIMKITHELNCPCCMQPLTISLEIKKKDHNLNEDKVIKTC